MPLIALAVVPSTLVRPQLPYLQGLMLFVLVAALRVGRAVRSASAIAAALVALRPRASRRWSLRPALDTPQAVAQLPGAGGRWPPAQTETFDWTQRYGPLHWPHTRQAGARGPGAASADYWKAENLDVFDGRGWVAGRPRRPRTPPGRSPRAIAAQWTQTMQVTIRG